ncbi:hypothetical protein BD410DRAFT_844770 [Rickenella mellea]|uniref:Uncharacterized protein n=1 Tax=Rickenella mellea TaxID=50990 RepID=A0A4Y7PKL8_9AGAM|nr:hypothetical protein BD410DRAFT_844770 [Rickenella mellea]
MIASRHLFFLYVVLTTTVFTAAAPVRDALQAARNLEGERFESSLNGRAFGKTPSAIKPVKAVPVKVPPVAEPPTVVVTAKATLAKASRKAPVIPSTALAVATTSKSAKASTTAQVTSSIASISATTSKAVTASATVQVTSTTGVTSQSVVATASACPVKRSPVLQTIQTRAEELTPLSGDEEHQVSLVRFKVGTDHEHWALFFHPTQPGALNFFQGTMIDAVIGGAIKNAVLTTDTQTRRFRPQNGATRTDTITALATVANGAAAQALVDKASAVQLTQQPPTQNCVDWTNLAMQALSGDITSNVFQPIFAAENAGVRDRTACNFACRTQGEAD